MWDGHLWCLLLNAREPWPDKPWQVAFAAYQQYRTAKTLTEDVKNTLSPNSDPEVCHNLELGTYNT